MTSLTLFTDDVIAVSNVLVVLVLLDLVIYFSLPDLVRELLVRDPL